jgi:pyruvate/2-oxoglutarate dehydrogenase complex dihydrolipoamide dehydrogenase (E3) component
MIAPIEGLKDYFWAEILEDHNIPENSRILVIGGGLIGTEIASKLLSKGNTVYIVEMLSEVARDMEMIERKLTLKAFQNSNINIFVNTRVKRISGKNVFLEGEDMKQTLENIDHIILSTGMKSYNPFGAGEFNKPVHIIGDALKVGKAQDAIENAFLTANEI